MRKLSCYVKNKMKLKQNFAMKCERLWPFGVENVVFTLSIMATEREQTQFFYSQH